MPLSDAALCITFCFNYLLTYLFSFYLFCNIKLTKTGHTLIDMCRLICNVNTESKRYVSGKCKVNVWVRFLAVKVAFMWSYRVYIVQLRDSVAICMDSDTAQQNFVFTVSLVVSSLHLWLSFKNMSIQLFHAISALGGINVGEFLVKMKKNVLASRQ